LPHLPILLLVLAVGFLAGGYYAAGPDEVSYAGLQFCITLVIVLGLSALPVDTATGAEGRVFGAAIGFLVALAIALGLWPDRPVDMLRHGVAASLRKAAALLSDLLGDPQPSHVTPERFREALYVDIRGNLEILHDASFIPDSQMKDHPDYKNMIHVSGMLFAQLFTLWDMLMRCETAQQRARVLGPLSVHGDAIVARLDDIADRIETQTFDVMSDIREQLRELQVVPFADTGNGSGEETEPEVIREERFFGIQIANDIIADLVFLVDDLGSGPKTDPLPAEVAVGAIEGS